MLKHPVVPAPAFASRGECGFKLFVIRSHFGNKVSSLDTERVEMLEVYMQIVGDCVGSLVFYYSELRVWRYLL